MDFTIYNFEVQGSSIVGIGHWFCYLVLKNHIHNSLAELPAETIKVTWCFLPADGYIWQPRINIFLEKFDTNVLYLDDKAKDTHDRIQV